MENRPRIVGVDTSSRRFCLGLINNKGKIVEYNLDSDARHAELFIPTIKKALRRVKLRLSEIDYFAVGLGPGSFTGLRIGLATIKGFALALTKPVIGLPTLDILASNAIIGNSKIICPLIDAKRNLLFTALYEVSSNQRLKRKTPYLLISIRQLLSRLNPDKSVIFLGDGLGVYQTVLEQRMKNSIFLNQDAWYPRGRNLIRLAWDLIDKGRFSDVVRIKPIYLYPKHCQIRNEK